jgi:uncharacterized membrane protein YfcA
MIEFWSALFPSTTMLVVMLLTAAVGATMRAFSGFGSGLLLAPVFSLYLSPQDVVAVVVLINLVGTIQMLPGVWRDVEWAVIGRMVPAALVGVPLGWMLLTALDPMTVRRLVAGIVIVLALLLLSGWVYKGARGRLQDTVAGVSSGILTAVAGIGGPPFILYMLSAPNYSPAAFRTFFTVFFTFSQLLTVVVLLLNGALGAQQIAYVGVVLPSYVAATALGSYLFVRALRNRSHQIKRISLLLLLVVGVIILIV